MHNNVECKSLNVWCARRSPVLSVRGICSSSQPLASAAGAKILQAGGNAADAAVAMAAVLSVIEPFSTGLGGDAFALYYDASIESNDKVTCLQGNGASSSDFTLELLASRNIGCAPGQSGLDASSGLCVTVPGAASLWEELVITHGRLPLLEVLTPAIELAEKGYPVGPVSADMWTSNANTIQGEEAKRLYFVDGRPPRCGDVMTNKDLACTLREMAMYGTPNGFYRGRIAESIVDATHQHGGVLTMGDLGNHFTECETPISACYRGIRVYEPPPPTQGIAALMALKTMEKLFPDETITGDSDLNSQSAGSMTVTGTGSGSHTKQCAEQTHYSIECMRLAFADALATIGDPKQSSIPVAELLSDELAVSRASRVRAEASDVFSSQLQNKGEGEGVGKGKGVVTQEQGGGGGGGGGGVSESKDQMDHTTDSFRAFASGETVYLGVIDSDGNGCSLVNSNYLGFGTGIVPVGCGFPLQSRGSNFSLRPDHPNVAGPNKRPYHTIIPALSTRECDGSLHAVFGVMGGFMQPQGHFQVIRNMIDFNLNPQEALDAPRWYVENISQDPESVHRSSVMLEDGYGATALFPPVVDETGGREDVAHELVKRGHRVKVISGFTRSVFGRGEIILRDNATGVLCAGSDPRSDGCAIPCL
eukprot:gene1073-2101_t